MAVRPKCLTKKYKEVYWGGKGKSLGESWKESKQRLDIKEEQTNKCMKCTKNL